jgi:hypothetical protein
MSLFTNVRSGHKIKFIHFFPDPEINGAFIQNILEGILISLNGSLVVKITKKNENSFRTTHDIQYSSFAKFRLDRVEFINFILSEYQQPTKEMDQIGLAIVQAIHDAKKSASIQTTATMSVAQ